MDVDVLFEGAEYHFYGDSREPRSWGLHRLTRAPRKSGRQGPPHHRQLEGMVGKLPENFANVSRW